MPMRSIRLTFAAAALLVVLAAVPAHAAPSIAQQAPPSAAAPTPPNRIIVEYGSGASAPERASARSVARTTLVRTLGRTRFQLVKPQAGQSVAAAIKALRADPNVRRVEQDGYARPASVPNDPLFGELWGLQNLGLGIDGFPGAVAGDDIHVTSAWDRTVGSPSVVVADIDTGYRFNHEDLASVAWTNPTAGSDGIPGDLHGADFVGSDASSPTTDGDPTDDDLIDGGHGVHTAGTIGAAGNNGVGISGVAQNVRIMPLKVCAHDYTNGGVSCPYSSEVEAINFAGAHGARVANMSLGGSGSDGAVLDAMAENPQVLFVVAAGNGGRDGIGDNNDVTPTYPCVDDPSTTGIPGAIDNVICVAATDQADGRASFSNYGASTVDLGAPGTEILSTFPEDTYFTDDFEAQDFASRWTATAGGGFRLSNESPLTGWGITDSPGAAPTPSTTVSSTSPAFSVPAGGGDCTLSGTAYIQLDSGGTLTFRILQGGSFVDGFSTVPSYSGQFAVDGLSNPGGSSNVQLQVEYTSGSSPGPNDGVWLDDISLSCLNPVTATSGYAFLQGTSMATPHVTGAAALLFSLKPSATVTDVKHALLSSVDPDPALAGITTSGGRLDVAAAMEALVPTVVTLPPPPPPPPPTQTTTTTTPIATTTTNPPPPPPGPRCVVPRLKGLSLAKAKRALKRAHCALGKVRAPRKPKHGRLPALVVKASSPGAGRSFTAGTRVTLTLAPKPKPKPKPKRHR